MAEVGDEMVEAFLRARVAYDLPEAKPKAVDDYITAVRAMRTWESTRAGLAAALETIGLPPEFHPVKAPAAVAKLYVIAALNEVATTLHQARAKYTADLSGDEPFKLLLAAEEYAQRHPTARPSPRGLHPLSALAETPEPEDHPNYPSTRRHR